MTIAARIQSLLSTMVGRELDVPDEPTVLPPSIGNATIEPMDIAPNDPIMSLFQSSTGVVEVDKLNLDSPTVRQLKEAGIKVSIPLVSQGELIGLLNLGPRLSEQEYSADDRRLLSDLASQAAPAVRVAQLAQQQQSEVRERERLEQELRVARVIQQTLLPESIPQPLGWQMMAHYQLAREVGGDFYDFLELGGGRLGLVIGDVTDKGVPAALVMATTRAILRSAAERSESPGEVLQKVNEVLHPDIPPRMFVTCLYAILDPVSGLLRYANAGHDLPYMKTKSGVQELRATGMPLGLMPGMSYEENEAQIAPGDSVLLYSDGLVEAHDPDRGMYGFPRLMELLENEVTGDGMIGLVLNDLSTFTGDGWEQEDDVTLVSFHRNGDVGGGGIERDPNKQRRLLEFSLASKAGNEREAVAKVQAAISGLGLSDDRLERLKTAVAEATMNAMEHGNDYREDLEVSIVVLATDTDVRVRISDQGGDKPIPEAEAPDLDAKVAGEQTARGWGLFLIGEMVDEINDDSEGEVHTLELVMRLEDGKMAAERLEAKLRRLPGLAVLDLSGDIDGEADEALNAAYDQATENGDGPVLLNFKDVDYINSTGIALIVGLLVKARKEDRSILASGLTDHYKRIFDVTRLSDYVDIYPDEETAAGSVTA